MITPNHYQFKVHPGSPEFASELLKLEAEGFIIRQTHPTLPLHIFNYSQKAQYEGMWNDITLQSRGLILDSAYQLISRPFPKFFNIEEFDPRTHFPGYGYRVMEKLDGSFLISYWVEGKLYWASKGSFTSPQANWANQVWENKYEGKINPLSPSYTYIAELIHPDNRIVVNYGTLTDVYITAIIHTSTGGETDPGHLAPKFSVPAEFKIAGLRPEQLAKYENNTEEGFVIKFPNNLRVKYKFQEYKRLHAIVTNVSSYDIWEALSQGKSLDDVIDRVPDEFYNWVKATEKDLQCQKSMMWCFAKAKFDEVSSQLRNAPRKEYAREFLKTGHPDILFAFLDGKDVDPLIWKKIKPKYDKPLSKEPKSDLHPGVAR